MTEPVQTGTDILRTVALNRVKRISYANLARDLGISGDQFCSFAEGRTTLPAETLQKMTEMFFGNASYDVASGLLTSSNKAPPRSYIIPDTVAPASAVVLKTPASMTTGPQPVVARAAKPKPRRQGWLGGLFGGAGTSPCG